MNPASFLNINYNYINPPSTPEKTFSIVEEKNIRYYGISKCLKKVFYTPNAKKYYGGTVYKILNIKTGQAYIGKTSRCFLTRLNEHLCSARHPNKDYGKSDLYDDMRAHPKDFVVGVAATLDEDCSYMTLEDLESSVISNHNTLEMGYNRNRGGGGGKKTLKRHCHVISGDDTDSLKRRKVNLISQKASKIAEETFNSPTKGGGSVRITKGRVRDVKDCKKITQDRIEVVLPRDLREKVGIVYGFRRDDGMWHIGETAQPFISRMYGYNYDFNHPESDRGKLPLPESVRNESHRWKVYLLYEGPEYKKFEKLWIEAKKGRVLNQRAGGGGSDTSAHFKDLSFLMEKIGCAKKMDFGSSSNSNIKDFEDLN